MDELIPNIFWISGNNNLFYFTLNKTFFRIEIR